MIEKLTISQIKNVGHIVTGSKQQFDVEQVINDRIKETVRLCCPYKTFHLSSVVDILKETGLKISDDMTIENLQDNVIKILLSNDYKERVRNHIVREMTPSMKTVKYPEEVPNGFIEPSDFDQNKKHVFLLDLSKDELDFELSIFEYKKFNTLIMSMFDKEDKHLPKVSPHGIIKEAYTIGKNITNPFTRFVFFDDKSEFGVKTKVTIKLDYLVERIKGYYIPYIENTKNHSVFIKK